MGDDSESALFGLGGCARDKGVRSAATRAWKAKMRGSDFTQRPQELGGLGRALWVLCEVWARRGEMGSGAKGAVAMA